MYSSIISGRSEKSEDIQLGTLLHLCFNYFFVIIKNIDPFLISNITT